MAASSQVTCPSAVTRSNDERPEPSSMLPPSWTCSAAACARTAATPPAGVPLPVCGSDRLEQHLGVEVDRLLEHVVHDRRQRR